MKGKLISDFRNKILDKKNQITDKEFFLSSQCHAYLQNLAEAICKLYQNKIELRLEWNDGGYVAYATDRYQLILNLNNEYFNKADNRIDKLVINKGITLHECGHMLFTDFHLMHSSVVVFSDKRKLFPEPKCEEYTELLTDMAQWSDKELSEYLEVWKWLEDAMEDGFIEYKILDTIPGEGQCLYALRKVQLSEFESVKVQKAKGLDNPSILFNSILSLAKYDTVKMDKDDAAEPAIAALLDSYDLIRNAVHTEKSYDRMKLINTVFCKLYHFMKEDKREQERQKEDNQNAQESGEQSMDADSEKEQAGNTCSEQQNSSDSTSQQSNESSSEPDAQNAQQDNGQAGQSDSGSPKDGEISKDGDIPDENVRPDPSSILDNIPKGLDDNIDTGSGSVLNDRNICQKPEEHSRNNNEKIDNIVNDKEPDAQIPSPQDMRITDSIEEKIAQEMILENSEAALAQQLSQEVQEFDFSYINSNVDINILRNNPSKQAYLIYQNDMKDISFLVKKTINEIRSKIKDHQQGGRINGLYQGRYLDQHSLYRYDCRILCKNDLPEDIPNMAFSILIDASGSMSSNSKLEFARKTALLLYEFGLGLNIPVMVYAHDTNGTVRLHALADYGSVDGNDKYRICDLSSGGCNRDGMALRFCVDKLSKRPEETKIMFVISDGLPSSYNSKAEAYEDIKNVLMDYSKKNIKFIAFGLGNDQSRIEEIYTQGLSSKVAAKFVRTDTPEALPKQIVKSIKELIKV